MTKKILPYTSFDYYKRCGEYAVRMYTRRGDGYGVAYFDTLKEAEKLRTNFGLAIGLEPEPTYKHFAYYPTIWKWDDGTSQYERMPGY